VTCSFAAKRFLVPLALRQFQCGIGVDSLAWAQIGNSTDLRCEMRMAEFNQRKKASLLEGLPLL
jgi:hypothetical protein